MCKQNNLAWGTQRSIRELAASLSGRRNTPALARSVPIEAPPSAAARLLDLCTFVHRLRACAALQVLHWPVPLSSWPGLSPAARTNPPPASSRAAEPCLIPCVLSPVRGIPSSPSALSKGSTVRRLSALRPALRTMVSHSLGRVLAGRPGTEPSARQQVLLRPSSFSFACELCAVRTPPFVSHRRGAHVHRGPSRWRRGHRQRRSRRSDAAAPPGPRRRRR